MARTFRACITGTGDDAENFRSDERELHDTDKAEWRSGRALCERMLAYAMLDTPEKVRAFRKCVEVDNVYLTAGASEAKLRRGCTRLRDDFNRLPVSDRPPDLLRLLIQKIPRSIVDDANRCYADRLDDELVEHERLIPDATREGAERHARTEYRTR